jgi:hypothetical protein
MFKKPQIVSLLFVFLLAGFVLITTNCDFDAGALMEKLEAQSLWEISGHADRTAEAFTHWNEDVPPVVSDRCAKCHSTSGYLDFLGVDGSAAGTVDVAPAIGETVECEVCHTDPDNGILRDHASVTFPSGKTIDNLGPEGLCMECHQGRESTPDVDQEITDSGVPDNDTIDSDIGFPNIHYYAAAATQFGTFVQGGYEYPGREYDARFSHVKGYNDCFTCHNPHSLEIRIERCGTCHTGTDPKDFRHYGSFVDYDGDGNMTEGIYYEIQDSQTMLYDVIQAYARQIGNPIIYDSHSHPYWFYDTNDNGEVDPGEDVDYESFTGRLLKACYNYQVSLKDPGGYAHGGKYIIQLLYDSIEDLNSVLPPLFDIDDFERDDEGHFDGSKEAWRHWDEDVPAEVEADCAKCHSAEGLAYYLENDAHIAQEITNGMLCTTCHTSPPNLRTASSVTFPSGISKSMGDSSNLCITCHQGRLAKATVDAGIDAGTPGQFNFTDFNVHYYAAGAVLYGTEVQGGYEFANKVYAGRNPFPNHNGRFDTCVECHMGTNTARETHEPSDHNVHKPNPEDCVFCHGYDVSQPNPGNDPSKFKFSGIRPYSIPDFDGDGNITESIEYEIKGLESALYAQMQFYGFFTLFKPIIYSDSYPYFFKDTNGNGIPDPGETTFSNQYGPNMDANLLKAAYNYQLSMKEPHGFIHNPFYIAQLLVDSIENLGGNVAIYTWR